MLERETCSKYSEFLKVLDLIKIKSLFLILTACLITSGDFTASKKAETKCILLKTVERKENMGIDEGFILAVVSKASLCNY